LQLTEVPLSDDYSSCFNITAVPSTWSQHINPEGKLYFLNNERHIITDDYLFHCSTLLSVEQYADELLCFKDKLVSLGSITMPEEWELVIQVEPQRDYYFVDHTGHQTFWLEPVKPERLPIMPQAVNRWETSAVHYSEFNITSGRVDDHLVM
jgi:hypothetical protein